MQVRIKVRVLYEAAGLQVRAGLGAFQMQVFPLKKEKRKKAKKVKEKQKKETAEEEPKSGIGASLPLFQELLDMGIQSAKRFQKKLRIDLLLLHLTWSAADPADAAIQYGYANGVLYSLVTLLEANFHVKKKSLALDLDYTLEKPAVYARLGLSMSLGHALSIGLYAGGKTLGILMRQKKRKKAAQALKGATAEKKKRTAS